jgi:hypothetical protein
MSVALMIGTVTISETSVYFYETTRCCIPESFSLYSHHCENLKSHKNLDLLIMKYKIVNIILVAYYLKVAIIQFSIFLFFLVLSKNVQSKLYKAISPFYLVLYGF